MSGTDSTDSYATRYARILAMFPPPYMVGKHGRVDAERAERRRQQLLVARAAFAHEVLADLGSFRPAPTYDKPAELSSDDFELWAQQRGKGHVGELASEWLHDNLISEEKTRATLDVLTTAYWTLVDVLDDSPEDIGTAARLDHLCEYALRVFRADLSKCPRDAAELVGWTWAIARARNPVPEWMCDRRRPPFAERSPVLPAIDWGIGGE